jgi:Transposase family tnp2
MRTQNILLPLIIPGPTHLGRSIDIYLQPLIDELKSLWVDGVQTYDCFKKQNFMMRVAVMWTISDFPGIKSVGSRFHVLRSRTHFQRYRGRGVLFSWFALPDSFRQ